jgi:hypothetical protein
MDVLANGLFTVLNGVYTMLDAALGPAFIMSALVGLSFLWIALIELDELNRQGRKPEIGRGQ